MTDIKLQEYRSLEGVTMDFLLKPNGVLDTSEELATAVRVALGTDRLADANEVLPDPDSTDRRGWWGDYQAEDIWDGWPVGTKNWLLMRAKISDAISEEGDTVERARIYTLEALQPFIDKGVCSRIDVDAERTDIERIEVHVTIYRGPKAEIDLRYQLLWEEETDAPDIPPPHRVIDIPKQSSSTGLKLTTTAPTVRTRWPQALKRDLVLSRFTPTVTRSKIITPARRDIALSPTAPTRSRGRLMFPPQANVALSPTAPFVPSRMSAASLTVPSPDVPNPPSITTALAQTFTAQKLTASPPFLAAIPAFTRF